MKLFQVHIVNWLLCLSAIARASSQIAVAAYLPEWRYGGANFDTICSVVTHLIFFSLEPSPQGKLLGMDRFPQDDVLRDARDKGCKLMICFGGNGRSSGFSAMTRNSKARKRFVKEVKSLLDRHSLDGVDYNWEYPGYGFGRGYDAAAEVNKDYEGLMLLLRESRKALGAESTITMAYYPDGKQEQLLLSLGAPELVDYFHIMAYDQPGGQHSSYAYAESVVSQGISIGLPPEKLTLGLPFYGRNSKTGDWTTYEDIVQDYAPLKDDIDRVRVKGKKRNPIHIAFNGRKTIADKTRLAVEKGLGGVMIWEVGQDCRLEPVTRGGQTHVATCPEGGNSSLLLAIAEAASGRGNNGHGSDTGVEEAEL